MKQITSAQNPRLKAAIRLKTSRGRKTQQRIIIYGMRELQRAIEAGIQPLEIFLCSDVISPTEMTSLVESTTDVADIYDLPKDIFARLNYGEREDGVVAIAHRPDFSLSRLQLSEKPLVVILESIEKPGNIGAVLRSMDGVAADALILSDVQCDAFHPNCIRASLGSAFTIPIAIASTEETIAWCQQNSLQILAARDSAPKSYTETDLRNGVAIALGNEAQGLSELWESANVSGISIPMKGISDSLNVSVAAAVIIFEAARQRVG